MIQHREYILIEVPEDAIKFWIVNHDDLNVVWRNKEDETGFESLPPGQYEIIGKANELSEEQWSRIVDTERVHFYKDYINGDVSWGRASDSGLSLLAHHNLKPETTLILKSIKL